MADEGPLPKKAHVALEALEKLTKDELIAKCVELAAAVDAGTTADCRGNTLIGSAELAALRESEEKLRQQHAETTRRENILIKTLTSKEQELAECASQIEELKQYQLPCNAQLRTVLLDPTVNLMFQRMRKELDASKTKLEESQNELSAWKFTPDSQTGKRLMARCRMLIQENEELGKQISSGRIAKLEGDIALERALIAEMKASQAETDEYLLELDGEMEGMQSTVYLLQQQLRESKEQLAMLRADNAQLVVRCNHAEASLAAVAVAPTTASSAAARDTVAFADPDCTIAAMRLRGALRTNGCSGAESTCVSHGEAVPDSVCVGDEQQQPLSLQEQCCEARSAALIATDVSEGAASALVGTSSPVANEEAARSSNRVEPMEVGDRVDVDAAEVAQLSSPASGLPTPHDGQCPNQVADVVEGPPGRAIAAGHLASDSTSTGETWEGDGSEVRSSDIEMQPASPHRSPVRSEVSAARSLSGDVTPPRTRTRSSRGSEASNADDDASQPAASGETPTSPADDEPPASTTPATGGGNRTPARRSARTKRRRAALDPSAVTGVCDATTVVNGHASS